MARYFFHTQTLTRTTDEEGMELASPMDARRQAIQTGGQMMRDCADGFWGSRPWGVTVTNDVGLILWEFSMDGFASAGAPA